MQSPSGVASRDHINDRAVFRGMNRRLNKIRHVALDMDGTIYKGGTLFATTDPFLELLGKLGIGYTFLTNNPSKSVTDYLSHLEELGIPATQEQLYTSAQATIEFLHEKWPDGATAVCPRHAQHVRAVQGGGLRSAARQSARSP